MSKGTSLAGFLLACLLFSGLVLADEISDNWNDFLHYTKIGRLDLAKGHAQALIEADPDPIAVLDLAEGNPNGLFLLQKARDNEHDGELQVLDISDPEEITEIAAYDSMGYAVSMVAKDDYLYMSAYEKGIKIYDISNPEEPVLAGYLDEDLGGANMHTVGAQKWLNLYNLMLDDFKGQKQVTKLLLLNILLSIFHSNV